MSRDEEIYAEAVEVPVTERGVYLDRACAGDSALRARLEALLLANDEAETFFEAVAPVRMATMPEEKPGERIGRYRLLQKIGEGGCGVVYMAEQEVPVRRRVALKVIKLGMDTKEVIARFEAERQALAMMDHPNIARVLDAGATETGRPFFVMELVRGIPITRYCDEESLSTEERLRLFVPVCQAIQHAHEKGIIHRDIKPSNILVTMHDDTPVPKVIDFGIAKATQGRLTDKTVFTAFEQFIGTPAYMSPEQAQMNDLEVDTRSDIYSLGVLLYELLVGRPPFDPKSLAQRGIDEVRRIIREVEPPTPSTRLNSLTAADRTTVAARRSTAPAQLSTLVRGDLDWVVMKALEKNRTRRYDTASGLAADIKRHLGNEPVIARPPSVAYRAQKFTARHKLGLIAAAAVVVSLGAGLTLSRIFFRDSGRPERVGVSVSPGTSPVPAPPPRPNEAARGSSPTRTTIISGSERAASGVLSPDESAIAYIGEGSAKGNDIELVELRSKDTRKLTNGAGGNSYAVEEPVWSPDSKLLAYWWWQSESGISLRIVSRDGGEPRSVALSWAKTQSVWRESSPSFSPADWSSDGKRLLGHWTLRDHSRELATVVVATGEVRGLGSETVGALHPRFAPDGESIVFERSVAGNRDVYLTSNDGLRMVRVTNSQAEDGTPVFSADGRHILFSSNQRGTWDLWAVRFENGAVAGPRFVAKTDFGDHEKRITATGKLAFTLEAGKTDVFAFDVASAGGKPVALAQGFFGRNRHAVWSPDGKRLAYGRTVGGDRSWLLCLQSSEDAREEVYKTGMRIPDWIFWAPDGQTLIVGGEHENGEVGLYLYSPATRERVGNSIRSPVSHWPLGFSPDGAEFNFIKNRKERIAVNLKTRAERVLSPPEELARLKAEPGVANECGLSRDGTLIAYVANDGKEQQLVVASADYRTKRIVAHAVAPGTIRSPSFSPDGTQVAYCVRGEDFAKQQLRVAAADGTADRLIHEGNIWHVKIGPRWSPDGVKVATTLVENGVAEIGVLENFLPREKSVPVAQAPRSATVHTIVSGTGRDASGALSPDETALAYSQRDEKTGKHNIAVRDLRTGEARILLADPGRRGFGFPGSLMWSRDSKFIAYDYDWSADSAWENSQQSIRIVSRETGEPKIVFAKEDEAFSPSDWSPDGKSIVGVWRQFTDPSKPAMLATLTASEGALNFIGPAAEHARFSPDGKFIAGERTVDGNRDVYVMSVNGAQTTRLTDTPQEDGSPTFSADGRFVLFSSNRRGTWDLWAVRVENAQPVGAPFLAKYDFGDHAKWNTSSGKLAFKISTRGSDVYEVAANRSAAPAGSEIKQLTKTFYGLNFSPVWSPDGGKIAFIRMSGTGRSHNVLCVQSLATREEQVFDPGLARFNRMFWAPDSQTIGIFGVAEGRSGGWGLYLFSLVERRRVADHIQTTKPGWPLGFSADGKEFIFGSMESRGRVAIDLATKAERDVATPTETAWLAKTEWEFDFSRDGARVAYVEKRGEEINLVAADAANNQRQIIARLTRPSSIMSPRLSPDGTKVAYYATRVLNGQGRHQLRICATDGSWDRLADTSGKHIGNATLPPSWSPDSGRIVVTLNAEMVGEIAVLEIFLPEEVSLASQPSGLANVPKAETTAGADAVRIHRVPLAIDTQWIVAMAPDGRQLAFQPRGTYDLAVCELATGRTWTVLKGDKNTRVGGAATFSPDGKWIAYDIGEAVVVVCKTHGTNARTIFETKEERKWTVPMGWSSDSSKVLVSYWDYVVQPQTDGRLLTWVDLKEGTRTPFAQLVNHERPDWASMSWTGRYVARRKGYYPRRLFVFDTASGREEQVAERDCDQIVGWTPDDTRLLYSRTRDATTDLCALSVKEGKAEGQPEILWSNWDAAWPVGVTREGNIYYAVVKERTQPLELWVMEGFLRKKPAPLPTEAWRIQTEIPPEELLGPDRSIFDRKFGLAAAIPPRWEIKNAVRQASGGNVIAFTAAETSKAFPRIIYWSATPWENPSNPVNDFTRAGPKPTTLAETYSWMRRRAELGAEGRTKNGYLKYTHNVTGYVSRTVNDRPALSWVSEFERGEQKWSECMTLIYGETVIANVSIQVPAQSFDAIRAAYDQLVESVRIP